MVRTVPSSRMGIGGRNRPLSRRLPLSAATPTFWAWPLVPSKVTVMGSGGPQSDEPVAESPARQKTGRGHVGMSVR